MTRFFISALALLGMGSVASAQFSVVKDGKVIFVLAEGTPDYIAFENVLPCGGVIGEAVDMGLSVKWSSVNIGASSPEQSGGFYAWGEIETKENYSSKNYKHSGTFMGDNKTTLDLEDDVAHVNWGGDWVMPSQTDWEEVYYNTTQTWTEDYDETGAKGFILTSTKEGYEGSSIFLPAAGYCVGAGSPILEGFMGYYWSSLNENHSGQGRDIFILPNYFDVWYHSEYRYSGQSVRAVCPSTGNTNGHVAVDLGLPSGKLWATCNVGASTPEASGDYFAWGETEPKEEYSWSTYKYMQSGKSEWFYINKYQAEDFRFDGVWYKDVKYCNHGDQKTTLEANDDVATQSWGSEWRMPTAAEWEELFNNTTQIMTKDYEGTGVRGYILTSTKEGYEGVSIFLPAVSYNNDTFGVGTWGFYWSSSLNEDDSSVGRCQYFTTETGSNLSTGNFRCSGYSVRPVCPANK